MSLKITVEGGNYKAADKFWEPLDMFIRSLFVEKGLLVRISRVDGGCDYRGEGEYNLTFRADGAGRPETEILLTLK